MQTSINKLIEIGGNAFADGDSTSNSSLEKYPELSALLKIKNGFFAFESALRIFPSITCEKSYGLGEWNSSDLWRIDYGNLTENCFFFAEDIFGGQYCYLDSKIYYFEPETGDLSFISDTLEQWAFLILNEFEKYTGYNLAHDWQTSHGSISATNRLLPKKFFVLGGEYAIDNLSEVDAVYGMKVRGPIARQIHSLPDGTQIELKIEE